MTMATDDGRLGNLEGRMIELSAALQALREEIRAINARIDAVNARIDRQFLAILGIGAAQIGLLITLVLRS